MARSVNRAVTVTMPTDWWDAASRLAARRQLSKSELVRELIRDALAKDEQRRLSEPLRRGQKAAPQ